MADMNRSIARTHGLPENTPPDKLLAHIRSLRLLDEFEKKPPEERERLLQELEKGGADQTVGKKEPL